MSNNQTIKNLRVKNNETSISQVLPIGADAVNVELANRRNLQETIGNIDSRVNGSITNNLEVLSSAIQTLDSIKADTAMIGSPLVAGTASEMTDTSHIYVYTGNESGYTNGNWYYYDGTIWASGGVYNSTAVETDKTLKVENVAADSRATGNMVLVSQTQPTAASNKIWIDPDAREVSVPTMDDFDTLAGSVADLYDQTSTYAVGDYCMYEGQLYKCSTAINTAQDWTAAHWTAQVLTDNIQTDLSSKVNSPGSNGTSGQVLTTNGNGTTSWTIPLTVDNTLSQTGKAADAKKVGDEITELKDDLSDIVTNPVNVNLFDKENIESYTIGEAINTNTGNTDTYANMCTTNYIVVKRNVTYSFLGAVAYYGTTNVLKIPVYKDDHTFLAWCWGALDTDTNVVSFTIGDSILQTDTGIIRLSFRRADIDMFMFVEGEYPDEYIPFEHPSLNPAIIISGIKRLTGHSIALNGDSICAGGGDAIGGYGYIIAENESMVYQNIGVAGGTIAYVSGRHCISRTMQNLYHYDYVLFEGGMNDKAVGVPLGDITEGYTATLDDTTFCGAFEQCCKTLATQYPTSKYGYIFVHRIAAATEFYTQWRPAMKTILEKWGVPYIDLQDLIPPLNFIDSLKQVYTNDGDGWHPNLLGYNTFYVDKITSWLKTL